MAQGHLETLVRTIRLRLLRPLSLMPAWQRPGYTELAFQRPVGQLKARARRFTGPARGSVESRHALVIRRVLNHGLPEDRYELSASPSGIGCSFVVGKSLNTFGSSRAVVRGIGGDSKWTRRQGEVINPLVVKPMFDRVMVFGESCDVPDRRSALRCGPGTLLDVRNLCSPASPFESRRCDSGRVGR